MAKILLNFARTFNVAIAPEGYQAALWESLNSAVASLSPSAALASLSTNYRAISVWGRGAGSTTLQVTLSGTTGNIPVDVVSAPDSVSILPPGSITLLVGEEITLAAAPLVDGKSINEWSSTWSSSAPLVATVTPWAGGGGGGTEHRYAALRGIAAGTAVISCTNLGVVGTKNVTVIAAPTGIVITAG